MQLTNKRILIISPEPWEGLHMSKHHLAQGLAKRGNNVVFLDPPSDVPWSLRPVDGLRVATYRHWLKGANHLPRPLHMWYYKDLLRRLAHRCGGPFDILWDFDTSRMQWFPNGMGYGLLHLADYNILHQGMGLVRTADLVLSTGQVVKDHVEAKTGVTVHNVGHALDERWIQGSDDLHLRSGGTPRRVVYAGQLALHYHDWEGWADIARAHPELDFSFIGPFDPKLPEPAFHDLRGMANVHFPGPMDKAALIPALREADILLFGFRSGKVARERANPHKVLEYLSTGNVVVGSWTMEYAGMPDLFCMAAQGAPLRPIFDDALARYPTLNSPEARQRRMAFVHERTMSRILDRIEQLMATGAAGSSTHRNT